MTTGLTAVTSLRSLTKLWLCLGLPIFLSHIAGAALYEPKAGWNFGTLELNHNSTRVSGVLNHPYGFVETFVIYIDSVPGGFSTTSGFTDKGNILRAGASGMGFQGTSRTTVNFAPGFLADYALVMRPSGGGVGLYKLLAGGEFEEPANAGLSLAPNGEPNANPHTFTFTWQAIGVNPNTGFNFQTTYLNDFGNRQRDSYESYSGTAGWNPITFTEFNVYGTPVPEMTTVALALFGGLALTVGLVRHRRR